jgi:hypothetical protein
MSETTTHTLADRPTPRLPVLCIHITQLLLAVAILGLDAYGVGYVAYNVLICSIVVVRKPHAITDDAH